MTTQDLAAAKAGSCTVVYAEGHTRSVYACLGERPGEEGRTVQDHHRRVGDAEGWLVQCVEDAADLNNAAKAIACVIC